MQAHAAWQEGKALEIEKAVAAGIPVEEQMEIAKNIFKSTKKY